MKKIIILFCVLIGVFSCRSTQTHKQRIEKEIVIQKDTLFVEKIHAINDTIFVQVPAVQTSNKECDTLCQRQLQAVLQQIQFHRKSAESKVGFYFDKYQNQLVLYQQLQEQFNTYQSKNKNVTQTQNIEVIRKVPVKYTPIWVQSLAWFGFIALLIFFYKLVNFFKSKIV